MNLPPMRVAIDKKAIPEEVRYVTIQIDEDESNPQELAEVKLVYRKGSSLFRVPIRYEAGETVILDEEWFGPK